MRIRRRQKRKSARIRLEKGNPHNWVREGSNDRDVISQKLQNTIIKSGRVRRSIIRGKGLSAKKPPPSPRTTKSSKSVSLELEMPEKGAGALSSSGYEAEAWARKWGGPKIRIGTFRLTEAARPLPGRGVCRVKGGGLRGARKK